MWIQDLISIILFLYLAAEYDEYAYVYNMMLTIVSRRMVVRLEEGVEVMTT